MLKIRAEQPKEIRYKRNISRAMEKYFYGILVEEMENILSIELF